MVCGCCGAWACYSSVLLCALYLLSVGVLARCVVCVRKVNAMHIAYVGVAFCLFVAYGLFIHMLDRG